MPSAVTHPRSGGSPDINASVPISSLARREGVGVLTDDRIAEEVTGRLRAAAHFDWMDRQKIWLRNLLVYHGEQWLQWNNTARRYLRKQPGRERRFTRNVVQNRVNNTAAKMTQQRPIWIAAPENTDRESHLAAKLAERLLLHDWRDLNLGRVRRLATIDCLLFGMGIIKYGWDKRARPVQKPRVQRQENGEVALDEMKAPLTDKRSDNDPVEYEGGVFARPVIPFSFFVPPGVGEPDLEACPWVMDTEWMDEEEIRVRYKLGKDYEFSTEAQEFAQIEPISSWLSRFATTTRAEPRIHAGQHLVIRYYEPASDAPGFSYGKVYTVVGNKLVNKDRSQFADGRYPFALFPWLPRRGMFWPEAYLTPIVEPQINHNQTWTQIYTWLSLMSNPNILVPKGSGIPNLLAFNFRRLDYNPAAGPPTFWTPPPPSNAIFDLLERDLKEMDRITGESPFGRGEPVPGVPAAEYASMMQEAAGSQLGPHMAEHGRAWESFGEGLIMLHQENDPEERTVTVAGKSNRPEVVNFKKATLGGKRMPIMIQESSLGTISPAARQKQLQSLIPLFDNPQMALDPAKRKRYMEYLSLPDLNDVEDGFSIIERFAKTIVSGVVDENKPPTIPQTLQDEPMIMAAVKDEIVERSLGEDAPEWSEAAKKAVMQLKQLVTGALQQAQQAAQQEALDQQRQQMGVMVEGEKAKSDLRKSEAITSTVAKAGADAIVQAHAAPDPGGGEGGKKTPQGSLAPSNPVAPWENKSAGG